MKILCLTVIFLLTPLLFAGCNQNPDRTIPPSYDETLDQQVMEEITQAESDVEAADIALEATDQAIEEIDVLEFGEAPDVE